MHSLSINILERTTNRNSVLTMHTHYVPNSCKVTYRIPKPVPHTKVNCESDDYDLDVSLSEEPWVESLVKDDDPTLDSDE
jgi:hypothetical protein